jgi:ATP-binding cassette subfamily F protein uup
MLQPADVLLLDEPTNDLDIPTLEILEESLLEYRGALVLVTHDRYMLDRISNVVLGLDGMGQAASFADYSQWEVWQAERKQLAKLTDKPDSTQFARPPDSGTKKKLSYMEAREYATLEERISQAEQALRAAREAAEDPAISSDAPRLLNAHQELEQAQKLVDELYARWAELEAKRG